MNDEFKGQVAIISGALGDIGRAIALELARRGADIALGDVRAESDAQQVLDSLRELGVRACYHRVDVADARAVSTWVAAVEAELGAPNLIIPNAAIVTVKNISEIAMEEWTREISINLNGAFYLAQSAGLKLLQQHKTGRIVFVGSWAAERPHPHIPAYSAAKAGLRMLMQCMALEWAPHGILVNEVAPGYVNAGLSGRIFDENAELKEHAIRQVPIHQLIEPAEVAAHVAYLCDPKNRHMTGSTLTFDGGLSLQGTLTP
jgi:NAD(P)-dependent dehydrogenase (short-subunit alcohol dehydrogenase family)